MVQHPSKQTQKNATTNLGRLIITAEFDRLHETSTLKRGTYIQERNDLGDRRTKLLHAHLDGAVPLDLMKEEQDKIARRLAFLDAQINAGHIEYDQAKAHLDDCLTLAGDCYKLYMSIDDSLRRIANQAFFDKLYVQPDDQIDGHPGEPFNIFFDPDVQQLATTRQRAVETGTQTDFVGGLNIEHLVDFINRYGNRRPPVARLVSVWNQEADGVVEPVGEPDNPLIEAAAEPRRRTRTRLTEEEADAMRTARASGASVTTPANQFGVHRGAV